MLQNFLLLRIQFLSRFKIAAGTSKKSRPSKYFNVLLTPKTENIISLYIL